jgi:hypothetical protein
MAEFRLGVQRNEGGPWKMENPVALAVVIPIIVFAAVYVLAVWKQH